MLGLGQVPGGVQGGLPGLFKEGVNKAGTNTENILLLGESHKPLLSDGWGNISNVKYRIQGSTHKIAVITVNGGGKSCKGNQGDSYARNSVAVLFLH